MERPKTNNFIPKFPKQSNSSKYQHISDLEPQRNISNRNKKSFLSHIESLAQVLASKSQKSKSLSKAKDNNSNFKDDLPQVAYQSAKKHHHEKSNITVVDDYLSFLKDKEKKESKLDLNKQTIEETGENDKNSLTPESNRTVKNMADSKTKTESLTNTDILNKGYVNKKHKKSTGSNLSIILKEKSSIINNDNQLQRNESQHHKKNSSSIQIDKSYVSRNLIFQ